MREASTYTRRPTTRTTRVTRWKRVGRDRPAGLGEETQARIRYCLARGLADRTEKLRRGGGPAFGVAAQAPARLPQRGEPSADVQDRPEACRARASRRRGWPASRTAPTKGVGDGIPVPRWKARPSGRRTASTQKARTDFERPVRPEAVSALGCLSARRPESQQVARGDRRASVDREDGLGVLLGVGDQPRARRDRALEHVGALGRALVEDAGTGEAAEYGFEIVCGRGLGSQTFGLRQIHQSVVTVALPWVEEVDVLARGLPPLAYSLERDVRLEEIEGRGPPTRRPRGGRRQMADEGSVSHRVASARSILPAGVRGSAGTARIRRGRAKAGRRFSA